MKKILKNSLLVLTLCFYLFPFVVTFAQAPTDYVVLTPLPGTTNCGTNTTTGNCTTNLGLYLPQMFNLIVAIAAGLAFVMITLGGITYATTDAIMEKSQGKEWVTNAIYGLLLVISAYLILYTINPQILDFSLNITQPVIVNNAPSVVASRPMTTQEQTDDAAVRSQLLTAGITVNNTACVNGGTQGCTNVVGLPPYTITELIALARDIGGNNIIITGGTEGGHATHGVGKPMVDLRPNVRITSLLMGPTGIPFDGYSKSVSFGLNGAYHATFTYESAGGNPNGTSTGDHWHVDFDK